MPKSRRASVVSLTKTARTDRRKLKQDLAARIHEAVDQYASVFVFSFANLRSAHFKQLRAEFAEDSRFLLGKNKVMQLALAGVTASSAAAAAAAAGAGAGPAATPYRPGLDRLAADLTGNVGLLFTQRDPAKVRAFFASYGRPDFARAGFVPARSIALPAGRMEALPHTMCDTLRKLGVPVRLDKGVVVVTEECQLCTAGEPISPEQGRLLKLFGHQLAVFSVTLLSMWQPRAAGGGAGAAAASEALAAAAAAAAAADAAAAAVAAGPKKGRAAREAAAEAAAAAAAEAAAKAEALAGPAGTYTRLAPLSVTGGSGDGGAGGMEEEDEDEGEDGAE